MSAQNIGETDRAFRIVGGVLLLLYAVISLGDSTQVIISVLALASIVTGMIGYSVLYALLGMSTAPKPVKKVAKKAAAKKPVAAKKKPKATKKSKA